MSQNLGPYHRLCVLRIDGIRFSTCARFRDFKSDDHLNSIPSNRLLRSDQAWPLPPPSSTGRSRWDVHHGIHGTHLARHATILRARASETGRKAFPFILAFITGSEWGGWASLFVVPGVVDSHRSGDGLGGGHDFFFNHRITIAPSLACAACKKPGVVSSTVCKKAC